MFWFDLYSILLPDPTLGVSKAYSKWPKCEGIKYLWYVHILEIKFCSLDGVELVLQMITSMILATSAAKFQDPPWKLTSSVVPQCCVYWTKTQIITGGSPPIIIKSRVEVHKYLGCFVCRAWDLQPYQDCPVFSGVLWFWSCWGQDLFSGRTISPKQFWPLWVD